MREHIQRLRDKAKRAGGGEKSEGADKHTAAPPHDHHRCWPQEGPCQPPPLRLWLQDKPGLRLMQYKSLIFEKWAKDPRNPRNQPRETK